MTALLWVATTIIAIAARVTLIDVLGAACVFAVIAGCVRMMKPQQYHQ